jgi:hypothetical protein
MRFCNKETSPYEITVTTWDASQEPITCVLFAGYSIDISVDKYMYVNIEFTEMRGDTGGVKDYKEEVCTASIIVIESKGVQILFLKDDSGWYDSATPNMIAKVQRAFDVFSTKQEAAIGAPWFAMHLHERVEAFEKTNHGLSWFFHSGQMRPVQFKHACTFLHNPAPCDNLGVTIINRYLQPDIINVAEDTIVEHVAAVLPGPIARPDEIYDEKPSSQITNNLTVGDNVFMSFGCESATCKVEGRDGRLWLRVSKVHNKKRFTAYLSQLQLNF